MREKLISGMFSTVSEAELMMLLAAESGAEEASAEQQEVNIQDHTTSSS
ncbi:hypothetical protein [Pelosinus propionicus]|uniref:Uncharacterized protein n=1 Tax=Pelosinus propionicus DSM 13327 TaxID=1123291 RepID=A0A1I4IRF7_9FIRM|nr:hypothetical protein [Pelosinus propionicus]SFL56431.1 hypothetical protein SAMN04490355_100928 [Pelosinus propionicus DSM 13327]